MTFSTMFRTSLSLANYSWNLRLVEADADFWNLGLVEADADSWNLGLVRGWCGV